MELQKCPPCKKPNTSPHWWRSLNEKLTIWLKNGLVFGLGINMILTCQILAIDGPKTHGWMCKEWTKRGYSSEAWLASVLARTSSISPYNASCILLARDLVIDTSRMCKGCLDARLSPWISSGWQLLKLKRCNESIQSLKYVYLFKIVQ